MTGAELRAEIVASQRAVETHVLATLLAAFGHARRARSLEEVALLLSREQVEQAIDLPALSEALRYYVAPALVAGLSRGAALQAQYVRARTGRLFRYDAQRETAARIAEQLAAREVQHLVSTHEGAARLALIGAYTLDRPAQARALGRALGLGPQEALWVTGHERALRSADPPLTAAKVARSTERYADRLRDTRLSAFALGGAQQSLHLGMTEAARQATQLGFLDQFRLVKVWYTKGDHLVRDTHVPMQGQVRELDEPFVSGGGALLMFPHDPNASARETRGCRCRTEIVSALDAP